MATDTAEKPTAAAEKKKSAGRPKGPKTEKTAEELREELAKNEDKIAKLQADLAVKEHPELTADIQTVITFLRELQKSDSALKSGADANVARERERLQNQRNYYEARIKAIDEALVKADSGTIIEQLRSSRGDNLKKLANAVVAVRPNFERAGVKIEGLIPTLNPYLGELATVPVDVSAAE